MYIMGRFSSVSAAAVRFVKLCRSTAANGIPVLSTIHTYLYRYRYVIIAL